MKYRATQKLLEAIGKGEFLTNAPEKVQRYVPYYECLIDINSHWTLSLSIDEDAIKNNPDYFESID